jgi:glucosamine-6-phosphate deaminase
LEEFKVANLLVNIHSDRESLGKAAADFVEEVLLKGLREKPRLRVVFAAAPSQNEMLRHLVNKKEIPWQRIIAFHMDEYLGLPSDSPQLFSRYLHDHIFSKVPFHRVQILDSQATDPALECSMYGELLRESDIDLVCMGIGENGHIAFNDPPVADFNDPKVVKAVELDERCRQQQVNDGCFSTFNEVPRFALTLTVPTLMSAKVLSIVVPGKFKAEAVRGTLEREISTSCPATILRMHEHARLFIDTESSSRLSRKKSSLLGA